MIRNFIETTIIHTNKTSIIFRVNTRLTIIV